MSAMLQALRREQRRIRQSLVDADRIAEQQAEAAARVRATNWNALGWESDRQDRAQPRPRWNKHLRSQL